MIAEVMYADGSSERSSVSSQAEATAWIAGKKATPKAGTFVWTSRVGDDNLPVLASPPPPPASNQIVRK